MWPLFEVFNETTVVQKGDKKTVQMDDPVECELCSPKPMRLAWMSTS